MWNDLLSDWISYIIVPIIEHISKMFQAVEFDFIKDFRNLGRAALNVCKEIEERTAYIKLDCLF